MKRIINILSRKMNGERFHRIPAWRPTPSQECLLKVAFSSDDDALKTWRKWKNNVVIDNIDGGAQRLLPLVYSVLQNLNPDDQLMDRLKGIYKKTWFINQIFLTHGAQVIQKLQNAGIPVLAFKGLALILKYYRDPGLRPMTDVDLAVPWDQAERAGKILLDLGYRFRLPVVNQAFSEHVMVLKNAEAFISETGFNLDLHWGLLKHSCYPGSDRVFWSRARPIFFKGGQALALTPEDQMIQVLEHGAYWGPVSSVRWVADALFISKNSPEFDWKYFCNMARKRHLVLPVAEMTGYLKQNFDFPIPDSNFFRLQNDRPSDFGIRLYGSMTQPKNKFIVRIFHYNNHLFQLYRHYLEEHKKIDCKTSLASLLRFFQFRWGLKSIWLVLIVFPVKLFMKIIWYLNIKFFTPRRKS